MDHSEATHETFERYMISLIALICAIGLVALSILGPLGVSLIEYKSSQSALLHLEIARKPRPLGRGGMAKI